MKQRSCNTCVINPLASFPKIHPDPFEALRKANADPKVKKYFEALRIANAFFQADPFFVGLRLAKSNSGIQRFENGIRSVKKL